MMRFPEFRGLVFVVMLLFSKIIVPKYARRGVITLAFREVLKVITPSKPIKSTTG